MTIKIILPILVVFALATITHAVSPAPDGGYAGGNTAEGQNALFSLTTGAYNTAVGFVSLRSNTEGQFNTAVGAGALLANTADRNTATGVGALLSNTSGYRNTAVGAFALFSNTEAGSNTAVGTSALQNNSTGGGNTAIGDGALGSNSTASFNSAIGYAALANNITGVGNTAIGQSALESNISGGGNTATGANALIGNTVGASNTADGTFALNSNTTGNNNTAMGLSTLFNNTTGNNNVAIGLNAGENQTTGSNNVYIGAGLVGVTGESNACYIGSIFGQTSGGGAAVLINATGKLGTATSSKRFKEDIEPMNKASEAVLVLKPVTFRYKMEIDGGRTRQFGLVAEDVEKVNPDLVVHDKEGKPYSVRYDAVNSMLLNEFLKEHKTVEELKSMAAKQAEQIEILTSALQKVTAQIEANRPRSQVVLSDR